MVGADILGHVLRLSSGMCSRLMLEGVPRPMVWNIARTHAVGRVQDPLTSRTGGIPNRRDEVVQRM